MPSSYFFAALLLWQLIFSFSFRRIIHTSNVRRFDSLNPRLWKEEVLFFITDFSKKYVLFHIVLPKTASILFESYDLSQKIGISYLYKVARSIRPTLAHAKNHFCLPQSRVK